MAEPVLSEVNAPSARPGRGIIGNLFVGVLSGAVAATGGVAIVMSIWMLVALLLAPPFQDPTVILAMLLVITFPAILAGLVGLLVGLLFALADTLLDSRLRSSTIRIWAWLLVGAVLGGVSSTLLVAFIRGSSLTSIGVGVPQIGALSGLIAGPIFGWLFRERTRGGSEVAQG